MSVLDTFTMIIDIDSGKAEEAVDKMSKSFEDYKKEAEDAKVASKKAFEDIKGDAPAREVKKVNRELKKTEASLGKAGSLLKRFVAGYLSFAAAKNVVGATLQNAFDLTEMDNFSEKINANVKDVHALEKGLERLGVKKETVAQALSSVFKKTGGRGNGAEKLLQISNQVKGKSYQQAERTLSFYGITDPKMIDAMRKGRTELETMMRSMKVMYPNVDKNAEKARELTEAYGELKSEWGAVKSKFMDALSPLLTGMLGLLTKLVKFMRENFNFVTAFLTVLSGVMIFGKIGSFVKLLGGLFGTFGKGGTIIGRFLPILAGVPGPLKMIGRAIMGLLSPFNLLIGLITLIVDDIMAFTRGEKTLYDAIAEDFPQIHDYADAVFGFLEKVINDNIQFFTNLKDKVVEITKAFLKWKEDAITTFLDFVDDVKGIPKKVKENLIDPIIKFFEEMLATITGIFNDVKKTATNIIDSISGKGVTAEFTMVDESSAVNKSLYEKGGMSEEEYKLSQQHPDKFLFEIRKMIEDSKQNLEAMNATVPLVNQMKTESMAIANNNNSNRSTTYSPEISITVNGAGNDPEAIAKLVKKEFAKEINKSLYQMDKAYV